MKSKLLSLLFVLALLTQSCAHQATTDADGASANQADSVDSINSDDDIFAELDSISEEAEREEIEASIPEGSKEVIEPIIMHEDGGSYTAADGEYFYLTLGGESVFRIAKTLYSDTSKKSLVIEQNPQLESVEAVPADQKVAFDVEQLMPEPMLITKQMISDYSKEMAEKINAARSEKYSKRSYIIESGDTLQVISQKLYGTTRYWTELYLVNLNKLRSFDDINVGSTIEYYDFGNSSNQMAAAGNSFSEGSDSTAQLRKEIAQETSSLQPEPDSGDLFSMPEAVESISEDASKASNSNNTARPEPKEESPFVQNTPDLPAESEPGFGDNSASTNDSASAAANIEESFLDESEVKDPIAQEVNTPVEATPTPMQVRSESTPKVAAGSGELVIGGIVLNTRRLIYLFIILVVLGAALLLTKPANKKRFNVGAGPGAGTPGKPLADLGKPLDNKGGSRPRSGIAPQPGAPAKAGEGAAAPQPLNRSNIKERISLRTQKDDKSKKEVI